VKVVASQLPAHLALFDADVSVVTSAQKKVSSIYISITVAIDAPMPISRNVNAIAAAIPVSHSRSFGPAAVPATIARIVTVNKLVQLFVLTTAAPATLRERCGRQGREQKQTHQNQDHLAILFHQSHNTSINQTSRFVLRG